MRTLPLGNTGEDVSALCLGVLNFGSRDDERTSYALLDQYIDAGGSFLDSANIYSHWVEGCKGGESDALLGRWMRERGNRGDLFIASKVGFEYPGVQRGLRAAQIEAECEKSLRRLGVETIDLYYAHVDDRATPLEETMSAFDRLVRAGKVRYIGASNYLAWRLEQAHWVSKTNDLTAFCCLQQRFTYLRPNPNARFGSQQVAGDAVRDYVRARRHDFTLLAYSALLGGTYTREDRPLPEEYRSADSEVRLRALREVAGETGATPNQIVLAWMLHSDPPVLPLIAVSTSEQLVENLAVLDIRLSDDQMRRLNEAGV